MRIRWQFLPIVACALAVSMAACSRDATELAGLKIDGLQEQLTTGQRAAAADLIVRGTAVSQRTKRFVDNPAIPASERSDPIYKSGRYIEVEIEVLEYLKGSGPRSITVGRLADVAADQPVVQLGFEQVLFLFEGEGVWVGSYLVLGVEGIGILSDGEVRFPKATMSMQDLRATVLEARS